jgi:serine protease Do
MSTGISVGNSKRQYSSAGSGIIYKLDKEQGDAYIVTNYHVVYDYRSDTINRVSDEITVYLYGQENEKYAISATYIGGSMNYDLAVLKVEGSRVIAESSAMAVSFHDSEDVAVLDAAIAIGNPESKGISATFGHVNVDSEYITMLGADNSSQIKLRVMRIDTAVNEGNSGGGLFNLNGELIGIVNAKIEETSVDNIGYAIPGNVVKYVAENIIEHCDGTEQETMTRCLVGITVSVTDQYTVFESETGRVHKKEGVSVSDITSGSLAEGVLMEGDVIKSITLRGTTYTVDRKHIVIDSMLNARVGDTVTFTVLRGGVEMTLEIEITEAAVSYPK